MKKNSIDKITFSIGGLNRPTFPKIRLSKGGVYNGTFIKGTIIKYNLREINMINKAVNKINV
jgi:hypothetical protein